MNSIEVEKRFVGVQELAQILDVDPESIYAKTSQRNRSHLTIEIPPWVKQGRLVKWWLPDVLAWIDRRTRYGTGKNDQQAP